MYNQSPILSPVGLDRAIARINLALSSVSWLTQIYQRAWVLPETTDNSFTAKVYLSQGDYYTPIPQDNEVGVSIVMATSPERYLEEEPTTSTYETRKERDIALIISCNLLQVDNSLDYVFTEPLKREIEVALANVDGFKINSYVDEDYRQVFSGLKFTDFQQMKFPYAAFRFNCTVYYGGRTEC